MSNLDHEVGVPRELGALDPVGLEIVGLPDAVHRRRAKPLLPGHAAHAPVRRVARLLVQRRVHHRLDLARADAPLATRTGSVLEQPRDPGLLVAGPPQQHRRPAHAQLPRECQVGPALGSAEHDAGAQRHILRRVPAASQRPQQLAIGVAERERRRGLPGHGARVPLWSPLSTYLRDRTLAPGFHAGTTVAGRGRRATGVHGNSFVLILPACTRPPKPKSKARR